MDFERKQRTRGGIDGKEDEEECGVGVNDLKEMAWEDQFDPLIILRSRMRKLEKEVVVR